MSLFTSQNNLGTSLSSATPRPPPVTTFSSLLAQANSLNQADRDGELPQIRYGLDEIERMSETVAGRGKRGKSTHGQGHTLLSNLGINTSQLAHTISQLPNHAESSANPRRRRPAHVPHLEPIPDIGPSYAVGDQDVGAWGRNWHETIILSGIEYQRQRTVKSFNDQFQARMLANWEADKARILQDELGVTDDEIARSSASNASGGSTLGKSSLGGSTRRFPMAQSSMTSASSKEGEFVMHTKMVRYERVIHELNTRRLRKEPFELCQALEESSKGDQKYPLLSSAYRILAFLTHEPSLSDSAHAEPVQVRQYAAAYLGDSMSNHAILLRGRLVAGGKSFLERDFETHTEETIAKHPKEAALGGIPGVTNKVRAFVDVILRAKEAKEAFKPELVDGRYLWAQVYYLLRCGYAEEALDLLSSHQSSLKRDDYTLPGAFKTYLASNDHRLPRAQRDQLYNDFNGHVRSNPNVDQFKYALYKIIGRFELSRKSFKVAATTEDWTWLQLSLVRESKDDGPQDQYDLAGLGRMVMKYGNEKFDSNGTRPFAWFNLLLFAGQFELAIAYLYGKSQLRTDAVHLAIALQYYGLLRVSPPEDPILTEPNEDTASLNFARLIKNYISPIAKLEPETALRYAYLVGLGSDGPNGERQKSVALELVRDVVLASRAWSKLLGSVRADGTKEAGIIERDLGLLRLSDSADYFRRIVLSAAEQSALDASMVDSIELYHLAAAPDKVVETVNRALGSSLSLPTTNQPFTNGPGIGISGAFGGAQDLYGLAQRVFAVYEKDFTSRTRVSKNAWETLSTLLQLKLALSQFAADRPDQALETFQSTNLLPLDSDPSSITRSAAAFKALLDQPTIPSLDEIVITAMKCLHVLSQRLKQSPYGDHGRMSQINAYKQMAQCLVQFASGLRLRLGPDVYRQLSSMSAFF